MIGVFQMRFKAAITGDMTLSLLDEQGFKILGIDMLSQATMRAGTKGDLLARALNDLTVLAEYASQQQGTEKVVVHFPAGQLSPTPWNLKTIPESKKVTLTDGTGKRIATRIFPKNLSTALFQKIVNTLQHAIAQINDRVRIDNPLNLSRRQN
jgi:hypothetical protein